MFVDGHDRINSIKKSIDRIRHGGMLVLDDSERKNYAAGVRLLAKWPRTIVTGLKFGSKGKKIVESQTTIFTKP